MEEISKEILEEYQYVRLIDVFVLAPIMIYASTNKTLPESVRLILFISGVATAAFNGRNFLRIEKARQK